MKNILGIVPSELESRRAALKGGAIFVVSSILVNVNRLTGQTKQEVTPKGNQVGYGLFMVNEIEVKATWYSAAVENGSIGRYGGNTMEPLMKEELTYGLNMLTKWIRAVEASSIVYGVSMGELEKAEMDQSIIALVEKSKGVLMGLGDDLGSDHDFGKMLKAFRTSIGDIRDVFSSVLTIRK